MSDVFETLLSDVGNILKVHHNRAAENGIEFNLLGLTNAPVNETAISKYLAAILVPYGVHGQELKPLQAFVDLLKEKSVKQNDKPPYTCAGVVDALNVAVSGDATMRVEPKIGALDNVSESATGGRIDIVFYWANTALIIENKPYAPGQTNQLARYYNSHEKAGYKKVIVVYLTKDGRTPDDGTRGNCDPKFIINLSFKELFEALYEYAENKHAENKLPDNNHYRSSIVQICRHVAQKLKLKTPELMSQPQEILFKIDTHEKYEAAQAIHDAMQGYDDNKYQTLINNIADVLRREGCPLTDTPEINYKWKQKGQYTWFHFQGWGNIGIVIAFDDPNMKDFYFSVTLINSNDFLPNLIEFYRQEINGILKIKSDSEWIAYEYYTVVDKNVPGHWDTKVIFEQMATPEFAECLAKPIVECYKAIDAKVKELSALPQVLTTSS